MRDCAFDETFETLSEVDIRTLIMGTDGSRNVGLFLKPIDAAVCPRRFY
jgi:hypothetical protein